MPRIVIVAGELSGDRLGAGLIRAVRTRYPDVEFAGIAGPDMAAAGCEVWSPSSALAVMGLAEVVRHLPRLRRILRDVERRLQTAPPDLYVGIDAPDFNLRVERRARDLGIPTLQYVCPSVWAWRQSRVRVLRAACDQVLCLLPFEAEFLSRHGVAGRFVGHPLADELAVPPQREGARRAIGIPAGERVIALLPGSRTGEVARLGPVFAATAAWLSARDPALSFLVPAATEPLGEAFRTAWRATAGTPDRLRIIPGQAHLALAAADAVLLASGTATLEAMLVNRPMVVAYRVAPLTFRALTLLDLVKVEHVALPNLLAGARLVPEFIQDEATPENLGSAVLHWLQSAPARATLSGRFSEISGLLRQNASERAADAVLAMLPAPYNS